MKSFTFLISIIFMCKSGLAFQPVFKDTLKVFPFDPVVVTGSRTEVAKKDLPITLSVISNNVIEEQDHEPLLDLVSENVPGLFVTQRTNIGYGVSSGSAGQISIRGIGGTPNTQVAVLIDGRPDIMGLFGHALGDAYFMHDIEKIEVVRGPASVLYGSNAMGGAINIIPRHKHRPGFHLYAPVTYGSYNTSQSFIRNTYDKNGFGYSLSLGYRESDGYRKDARDTYTSVSGNLELHGQITDDIHLVFNSYSSNSDIYDPGQISAPADTQFFSIKRRGGDLTLKHEAGRFEGDLKLHYNSGKHSIFDGFESDDFTSGILFIETLHLSEESRISGGIDLKRYGGEALLYGNWVEHDVNEQSIYANYHQKLMDRINIDGGVRYTNHSISGNLVVPSIGFSAKLPYNLILRSHYSEGYRNPTINELYLFMPSTTDLDQETSVNLETSLEKQIAEWFTTTITLYKTVAENLIQKGFINGGPLYQNSGEVSIAGIEIEGQLLLPPRLALNWSMNSSNFSEKLNGSPGEKANLALRYKFTETIIAGLQGEWINNLYSDSNPYDYQLDNIRLDSYTLVNLNARWIVNDYLEVSGKLNNLTDTSYQTMAGYPMPGRNFTIGITAKY